MQRQRGEQLGGPQRHRDGRAVEQHRGVVAEEPQRQRPAPRRGGGGPRRVQQVPLGQRLDGHLPPVVEPDAVHARLDPHAHRPARVRLAGQDPPGRGDQRARPAAQAREVRHVADPQLLVRDRQAHPQLVLRQLRRRRDQLHHRRVRGVQRAADVDGADQRAGVRVVDGRGRAGPGVDGADQVLGGVDLHRPVDGERGAHRVRADRVFGPAHARREPDGVGRAQQAARALAPQDRPVRVGDDHDVHGLVRDAHQRAAQQRQDGPERVRGRGPRRGRRPGGRRAGRGGPGRRGRPGCGATTRRRASAARSGRRRRRARRRRPRATPGPARPGRWSRRRPTRCRRQRCGRRATRLRPRPS